MTTRDPYRGLVMAVSNTVNGVLVSAYLYDHDALGRVVSRNDDIFGYNPFSELTSAAIGSNVCHYAYDGIGNAHWTDINGILTLYHTNPLNQYTNILRTSSPPCELEYDPDGNMTNDGIFTYIWDGENRLIAVYNDNALVISNAYDHQSRRVLRITPNETRAFLYDGWNLVQETITTSSSTTTNHYVWGKDLSGTLQGAGGVGGLLAVCVDNSCYFPLYDNNGNITAYVAEGGVVVAEYIYDAFGNTISQSGSMADTFPHRFSTKYYDAETGFYYYGYRFYSPALMRWLNRDPIGEEGGANRYAMCLNDCVNVYDGLGLYPTVIPDPLQWFTYVVEGCNPGEWYGGAWHGPRKSGYQQYAHGNSVSFSHKCGVNLINRKFGMTDGICNTAPTPSETDSRSRITIYAENHDKCCERFRIWCNWNYKGSGHGGSKGNMGALSIMPAWRKQNDIVFIREGTHGYITRVSLERSMTVEPPGEMTIPFGSRRMVFAISAYIHAGERHSIAEIEESGAIQCSSMCISDY